MEVSKNPKDSEIKVVDRRASSGATDAPAPKKGAGFTMEEKNEAPPTQLGEIDFSTLIFSLATGSLINMGLAPDPITKKVSKNLELARQNIDILSILEVKTKGNLTAEENTLLENLLAEIRLKYVQTSKKS